jgi:hypothetical protein
MKSDGWGTLYEKGKYSYKENLVYALPNSADSCIKINFSLRYLQYWLNSTYSHTFLK